MQRPDVLSSTLHFLYVNSNYVDVFFYFFFCESLLQKVQTVHKHYSVGKTFFFDRIRALLAGLLNITLKMWWFICVFVQFCSQPAGRARRTSMKALSGVSVQLIHRNSCLCCTRVGEWRYICKFIRKCPQYNPFASLPHHALNSPVYGEGKKINSHIKARLHLDLLKEQIPKRLSDIIIRLPFGGLWVFKQNIDVGFSISPLHSLPI